MYRIIIKKIALKSFEKLPLHAIEAINDKILELAENPKPTGCKKLISKINLYRIRVNDYRIVYSIFDDKLIIEIIRIAHRKDVYKNI